ncbi:conserved hypothetical protein [Arthrobacter sp. FB24]|uniref:DUF2617 family protein n=1 Tax=Arthrobacter sp. (strain FB24) TaxID=290399 RepID=UPI0000527775|nr:DUF2617 family protein [Arthrobacter sp. FB24]ABK02757.1 conserved hypothetical protein [Arthrobacter sp. FB24]
MHHTTSAPFVDTSPADLTYTTAAGELPALATKAVGSVELRVLGASHQVRVGNWMETLACQPGQAPHLPPAATEPGYTFTARVDTLAAGHLATEVAALTEDIGRHPHGLLVAFQGDPLALTGMTAEVTEGSASWTTWHVYPQTLQIVTTHSTLNRRAES